MEIILQFYCQQSLLRAEKGNLWCKFTVNREGKVQLNISARGEIIAGYKYLY